MASELEEFIRSRGHEGSLRVEESLGHGYVRLNVSEAERRQAQQDIRCVEDAVLELLRNARDAGANNIYIATAREADVRRITVIDDGCGIPKSVRPRVFEARVTSKLSSFKADEWGVHGRGMALYSISQTARASEVVASGEGKGCAVYVEFDCNAIPEKSDQSSLPVPHKTKEGETEVTGPHNIARTVYEFARTQSDSVHVYLGSPLEVAATLYYDDPARITLRQIAQCSDEDIPVVSRLRLSSDAEDFARRAGDMGLGMSARSAHRILSREIDALDDIRRVVAKSRQKRDDRRIDLERDRRGLKMRDEDVQELSDRIAEAVTEVCDRYYAYVGDVELRVRSNSIQASIILRFED